MTEPEPSNSLPDDDRTPAVEPPPAQRPDWLVGADEGVAAEQGRQKTAGTPLPFKLNSAADRAADPEVMAAKEVERPIAPIRPVAPQGPPAPPKPVAWTAASSSVPTLKGQSPPASPKATSGAKPAARPAAAAGEPGPARSGAASNAAHRGAAPGEPAERAPMPDFDPPADGEEDAASFPTEAAPAPRPRPMPRPLEEPWWVIALDTLRANRAVQLGIGGVILITLTIYFFWPHSEPGVSLRSLRHDAARWDGHIVRVEGRVGEVFPMGDGYAYNLHQGRDTIVVFTRTHHPISRQNVTVVGSVTTGFLDGEAHQAIFEN
jgi:hypothetical protein